MMSHVTVHLTDLNTATVYLPHGEARTFKAKGGKGPIGPLLRELVSKGLMCYNASATVWRDGGVVFNECPAHRFFLFDVRESDTRGLYKERWRPLKHMRV